MRILVTAGGTIERIDKVRHIANFSTGMTGSLLAQELSRLDHRVTLLISKAGYSNFDKHTQVDCKVFETFGDLESLLSATLSAEKMDLCIHAAAVSDYRVAQLLLNNDEDDINRESKLPSGQKITIRLEPNPKLINQIKTWSCNPKMRLCGFKLTVDSDKVTSQKAVKKLFNESQCDMVVHNDIRDFSTTSQLRKMTLWESPKALDSDHHGIQDDPQIFSEIKSTENLAGEILKLMHRRWT